MTDRDESFWPQSLQEQLDQLAQAASHSTRPNIPDTRLEEDLRTVYTEYTQAGERVWARLAEHLAEHDPQDEALLTLLQNVNLDPRLVDPQERAGILSQARTRLFQTNPETFKAEQRAAPALREPGSFPSKPTTLAGKPLRSRRLLHMLNMLAAALVVVALLGASLLLFRH